MTGERSVVLRGDEDLGDAGSAVVHLTVSPGGAVAGEHVHPALAESFRLVSGTLGTRVDGVERTLSPGEEVTVPAGVTHDWWNAGPDPASVIVELTPPDPRFEQMIATVWGLANDGKADAKGKPHLLQLALIGQEFSDVIVFTKPPPFVQKLLFGVLGAIGRARGLRGVYPEYLGPDGRAEPDPEVVALAGVTPPAAA